MPNNTEKTPNRKDMPPSPEPSFKIGKRDLAVISIITIAYSILAFYNLGDIKSPQTAWHANDGDYVVFELASETEVKTTTFMPGARNNKSFRLSVSSDNHNWHDVKDIKGNAVFRWQMEETVFTGRYVRITSLDDDLYIQELSFLDTEGILVNKSIHWLGPLRNCSHCALMDRVFGHHSLEFNRCVPPLCNPEFLIDEQDLIPSSSTFLNSTYFDEIYHARTAYEFIHGLEVYEWSHPPLGKAIISSGILLFGMSPFGWRFAGTLFGVLMLPVMYIFAKKVFHDIGWAFFATFLFTFDFMRFTQSRIATIDVFVTFFIMIMFLFLYLYYSLNFFDISQRGKHYTFIRSLLYLLCCGIFLGLAVAVKWQGFFAMLGIPVIVLYTLHKRRLEYKSLGAENSDDSNRNTKYFKRYTIITLICCVLFFVVTPLIIYSLSYIPFLRTPGQDGISSIIENQVDMFKYHSRLETVHPYSSPWFTWPLMLRPVLYYSNSSLYFTSDSYGSLSTSIKAFGNPAIWWIGIAALVYCARSILKQFNTIIFFLLVAYASLYLPWIFVGRTTFIYHYFPCVPFVILMITYMFKHVAILRSQRAIVIYLSVAFFLFVAFYPVLSGRPVKKAYVGTILSWSPAWTQIVSRSTSGQLSKAAG